jgi:hypothetical protein
MSELDELAAEYEQARAALDDNPGDDAAHQAEMAAGKALADARAASREGREGMSVTAEQNTEG